jgi:hypothetical protein
MRVFCPGSSITAAPPSNCIPVNDDLFSKPVLLLPSAHDHSHQLCACASLLSVHIDIITERMSQVLPHAIDVTRICSAKLAAASCSVEDKSAWLQLSQRTFDFASAAVQVDSGKSSDGSNVTQTRSHSSCNAGSSSIECWCSNGSNSCPWEPLVNSNALDGMIHDAPLPLSLAASLDKVRLDARHRAHALSLTHPVAMTPSADHHHRLVLAACGCYCSAVATNPRYGNTVSTKRSSSSGDFPTENRF